MKAGFAEGITAPRTAGSVAIRSIASMSSSIHSGETTFIGLLGSSRVTIAIPSASTSKAKVFMWASISNSFDDRRSTESIAGAQRDERGIQIPPLQLIEHRAQDHGAGGAEWMAHGDGAAVDVHLARVELELPDIAQHHRGERL